jgi:hypothetical protein
VSTNGGSSFSNVSTGTGGTTASYTTPTLTTSDSGYQYRVIVTDSATPNSQVTSSAATVTVNSALSTSNPSNVTADAGQTATFSTTASGGTTPYSYQWQVSTNSGVSFSNISGATSSSYTTGILTTAANGYEYKVIVTDSASTPTQVTSTAATLTVNSALSTTAPANVTAYVGQTANFSTTASGGTTPYSYQWQLSTDDGSSFSNISGATSASYTTPILASMYNGYEYRVVVTDSTTTSPSNSVTSAAATLTVNQLTITPSGDGNETINPSTPQSVNYNATKNFIVTANAGYTVNASVGGTCPTGSWNGSTYTTGAITTNCTVIFSAALNTVTPSGDGNETISPSTPQVVSYNGTQAFTVTANSGYALSSTVGGTCPAGSWSSNVYTTGAITTSCTVTFSSIIPAYISNSSANTVLFCSMNPSTRAIGGCTTALSSLNNPQQAAITPNGAFFYVPSQGNNNITYCSISVNGSLNNCQTTSSSVNNYLSSPSAMTINAAGTYAYIANYGAGNTVYCQINNSNGSLSGCGTAASSLSGASGVAIDSNNYGYVSTINNTTVSYCPVNGNGTFGTCTTTGSFTQPNGVSVNGSYAYVSGQGAGAIYSCPINSNGSFGSCTTATGFSRPFATALFMLSGTQYLFVGNEGANNILSCPLSSNIAPNAASCSTAYSGSNAARAVVFLQQNIVTPSGDGHETISPSTIQVINSGATSSFIVTASSGYTLSTAVGGTCPLGAWNGSTYTTGTVTSSCSVIFAANSSGQYTVAPRGDGNEVISPSTPEAVSSGSTQAFTVTVNPNYTLSTLVGGTCPIGSWSSSVYTTGNITSNCEVMFAANASGYYSAVPLGDGNETISPSTPETTASGSTQSFTVTANSGYTLSTIVGGTCPTGSWNNSYSVYTTGDITSNCTVIFAANASGYYSVVPLGDGNETFSPNTPETTASGGTQSFTVTANTGYTLNAVGGTCGGSLSGSTYRTNPITANCSVIFSASIETFTVTPSGDGNETINPATPQTVNYGSTQSFTVTPNSGHAVSTTVGGTCPAGSWSGYVYTTGAITSNCTVTFSAVTGYSVGGTVAGLAGGSSVVLQNNGGNNYTASSNGSFTFTYDIANGATYNVTALTQPSGQICNVTSGSGTISAANVTTVAVNCNNIISSDSFTNASAALSWTALNSACLTASGSNTGTIPTCSSGGQGGYNGSTPDTAGQGVLRFTTATTSQEGGIISSSTTSTSQNLAFNFTHYAYGGNGADGISFFLIYGTSGVPSALGGTGSTLGYTGIAGGYIGIGLDEYGGFASSSESIGIRGPTSASNPLYISDTPGFNLWQNVSTRSAASALNCLITLTSSGTLSVFLNGTPYLAGINIVSDAGALPSTIYFGFAGVTGGLDNIHEISNFTLSTLSAPALSVSETVSVNPLIVGNAGQYYQLTITNSGGSASSGNIRLLDTLPTGITLSGPLTTSSGTLSGCNGSGSSSLGTACNITGATISATSPGNTLTVTIPITVASSAEGSSGGNNSASISGGGDPACVNTTNTVSTKICVGSVTGVAVNS